MSSTDEPSASSDPYEFRCVVREAEAAAIVELHGELDLATVPDARSALESVLNKRSVTLDLRPATFIDSTGLRLILEIDGLARSDGFNFFVVRGGPRVQRLFEMTRADAHLVFVDAPEQLAPPE